MNLFDLFQLAGGFILSFGYLPQIIQLIKTKSARDLNLKTLFLIFFGIFLMELYAINLVLHNAGHMFLITNTMSLILSIVMYVLAWKYKSN